MWWLNYHSDEYINNSLIVVGLTVESRNSWYDPRHKSSHNDPEWNKHVHSTFLQNADVDIDSNWKKIYKYYISMCECDELHQLYYETTVRLFDGVACRYNIPVIQFNALASTTTTCNTLYNFNSNVYLKGKDDVFKRHGHPNEKGHQLIAKKLIERIDTLLK